MGVILDLAWHVAPFILVLSLVVTIHELGHFLAARSCGVAVERFSMGFGRAIFSRRDRSGVEWRIGWIPLGGYVMFAGDHNAASVPDAAGLKAMKAEEFSPAAAPRPWRGTTISSRSGRGPSSRPPVRPPTFCWPSSSSLPSS